MTDGSRDDYHDSRGVSVIRETPERERPRERLEAHENAGVLSDAELIAILLRTGGRHQGVMELAREVVEEHGGLAGLVHARPRDLMREGIGSAKAASVVAAVEIGRRMARKDLRERRPLARPAAVASYLGMRYGMRDQEVMGALFLDVRNRLLGEQEIYRGTLSRAAVEPRQVLKEALVRGAAGVVIFHNHPSGDPSPSLEDVTFTRRMAEAGDAIGVRLVDHMILGAAGRWVSLKERGAW
jgi:DNA repair protein RadC